ncbi:hypothetical protein KY345_03350 [Candidatus Woesearchaeota archaeon]|nr:hypothetical protein [Candidatus Woesearchaeota archaeon]
MHPKIGHYSFLAGIALAIIAGIGADLIAVNIVTMILVILGLIVGFLNVTAKETTEFLIATVALMLAGSANLAIIPAIGGYLQAILANIVVFVAPAALIVALKAVKALASK